MALSDVIQAVLRDWRVVRRADLERDAGALAAARAMVGVLLEERDEAKGRAERLGQSQQATLEKLAACQRDLQTAQDDAKTAQEAHQRAEVDLDTVRAALDAAERGLAAAQVALAERTAQLDTALASIAAITAKLDAALAELKTLAMPPTPPSPPPFNVAYVSTPVSVVRAAIEPVLAPDFITGKTTPPDYTDANYNLFHPMDIVPFCDYWRANLMPPARGEESDCDDRAFAFAVDLHRWSGYLIRCGVVQVTAEWALVAGNRWPHYIPVAVAPDGTPWCIDPAFLAQPEPYSKARVQVLRGIFY